MGFKNGFWVWLGREEWVRYGFTQRKKSRGCVCDGGSVRGSSEAEMDLAECVEGERRKKKKGRGGRGVSVGERENQKKNKEEN